MKNALTSSQGTAAVSEPWREALRTFDADLQRRGAAERTRKAYGTDAAELAAWATANRLDPTQVDYKALRRWAARLTQKGAAPARWRASSRRPAASSAACSSTATSAPTPPTCCPPPSSRTASPRRSSRRTSPSCSTRSRPARRSSSATAPCSSSPTAAASEPRNSSISNTQHRLRPRAGPRRGQGCEDEVRPRWRAGAALDRHLSGARAARAAVSGTDPALFLRKSGRRLSTCDVRRRLRVWARHAAPTPACTRTPSGIPSPPTSSTAART